MLVPLQYLTIMYYVHVSLTPSCSMLNKLFRIFNPSEQTKKFDTDMLYIKKWINNFTADYLPPIVEHTFARKRALEVFKKSLLENV